MLFPSTAAIISDAVGAKNAFGFDLSAACSGLFALKTARLILRVGLVKK